MSEENVITDVDSLIDFVLGDEAEAAHHSPGKEDHTAAEEAETTPEVKSDAEEFDPYGDNSSIDFADDSVEEQKEKEGEDAPENAPAEADSAEKKEEKAPEKTTVDYQQEITNLNKRLHDTQKAFHESTERASRLQKRLDELEKKKVSEENDHDDNWFSDADSKEVDSLKQELSDIRKENEALGSQQQEIQQQANLAAWHQAAEPVRQEHADFDELVYEKLEPLLDEETGDARVRQLYMQQQDKTPAGAYKFARSLPMILEMLNDPESFHRKITNFNQEIQKEKVKDSPRKVTGNEALRVMNSADFAEERSSVGRSLVDELFD